MEKEEEEEGDAEQTKTMTTRQKRRMKDRRRREAQGTISRFEWAVDIGGGSFKEEGEEEMIEERDEIVDEDEEEEELAELVDADEEDVEIDEVTMLREESHRLYKKGCATVMEMEMACRRAEDSRDYPNRVYHRVVTNDLFKNWMMWREEFSGIKEASVGFEGDVYGEDSDDEDDENPWKVEEEIRDEGEILEKQNRGDLEFFRKEEEVEVVEQEVRGEEKRE